MLTPRRQNFVLFLYTGYKTVRQFSLPAETVRHIWLPTEHCPANSCFLQGLLSSKKWLPVETVRMTLLPAESLGRKQNHADSLCRKPFIMYRSLGRKQKFRGQSRRKPNMMYSLCRKRKLAELILPCVILTVRLACFCCVLFFENNLFLDP